MTRLIDADELKEQMRTKSIGRDHEKKWVYREIAKVIDNIPTVPAFGKWILTVGDLIERRPDVFGIKRPLVYGRVVAMSSKTGKRLFDTCQNKDAIIAKYYGCEVVAIWTDLKVTGNHDFGRSCAEPVIMLYVCETQEDKGDE